MQTDARIIEFDFIRAFCVLYIVGVWHLNNNYLDPKLELQECRNYMECITTTVLATFTFISGYMLRKYKFSSWHDVLVFYRKRVLRFYPLFLLSALSLFIMRWMDVKQMLFGICGLAMFTSTPVKTLWYISMLMLLYAITPLIRTSRIIHIGGWGKMLLITLLYVILSLLYYLRVIDVRLMIYAPIYVLGLFAKDLRFKKNIWLLIAFISVVVIITTYLLLGPNKVMLSFILSVFGVAFLVALAFLLPIKALEKPISFLAYSSMAAYLFHRQIFGFALFLFGIKTDVKTYLPFGVALLTLLVVFALSWCIQKAYDIIVARLQITSFA